MKFWDASAIVPLLVAEPTTRPLQALAGHDPDMLVWWGSEVECVSALARLGRAAELDAKAVSIASERLKQLANGWHEVEPSEVLRESAVRFCPFIRCGQPMHYSLRQPSWPRSAVRIRSK